MAASGADSRRSFGGGLWRLADPKISLASLASIALGAGAAAGHGPLSLAWLAWTVAGIFAVEVAKNASGEIFDFDSGADLALAPEERTPFSGGKRVLVDGLLTRRETWGIAIAAYLAAAAAGIVIALFRDPRVLWLALPGLACAFFYHAPPLRLSYRGLGEAAVALCYGPGIAAGTFLVQRGEIAPDVLWASVPLGLLIAAFLWANELPDRRADARAGKRTLVVRLGASRAGRGFALLVAAAALLQALWPWLGSAPGAWLGLAAVAPAALAARTLWNAPREAARIVPAQKNALLAFVLLGAATGLGLALLA